MDNRLRLQNRTNDTTIILSPESVTRWRKYLMAFKFRGKKKKGTSVRLTGMFKTKRRGLWVGSVTELEEMKGKIGTAIAEDKGLVFFLWKNEDEDGPAYTLSMDVSQDEDRPKGKPFKKRKPAEDEDDEQDEETEEKDDDEEVPF